MDIREKFEHHIRRHKKLFNRVCYILSDNGEEEYELLCTEAKPKEQEVAETKNMHKQSVVLYIIQSDLKNAKNMLNEDINKCPITDFTGYKINYKGDNYVVYQVGTNGSFSVVSEIYCRLI